MKWRPTTRVEVCLLSVEQEAAVVLIAVCRLFGQTLITFQTRRGARRCSRFFCTLEMNKKHMPVKCKSSV